MSLLVAMLGLALSSPALAQPAASPANQADATLLYNEGVAAAKLEQWNKSHAFYLGAWRLKQHWQIAANLGRVEVNLGQHRGAAEHLTYFLREAPNISPADRQATQKLIEQAKTKVGTLVLAVNQPGAEIRIDGGVVGTTPLPGEVFVEPGAHVVEARLDGYELAQAKKELQAGGQARVDLQLVKEAAEKPAGEVPPGPLKPEKAQESGPDMAVIVFGGVATAVMAGAGAGFSIGAEIKGQERDSFRPVNPRPKDSTACFELPCREFTEAEISRLRFAVAAITSYVAAGIIGGGTLTYGLARRSTKSQNTARVTPVVGPGTAGVSVTVSW